jgi:hypothetical protein
MSALLENLSSTIGSMAKSAGMLGGADALTRLLPQAAAESSRDGGFLGIGGTLVSSDEQSALDAIKAALA